MSIHDVLEASCSCSFGCFALGVTALIVPLVGVAVMLALLRPAFPPSFISVRFVFPPSSTMLSLLAPKDSCCADLMYLFLEFNAWCCPYLTAKDVPFTQVRWPLLIMRIVLVSFYNFYLLLAALALLLALLLGSSAKVNVGDLNKIACRCCLPVS
jgi:hypothetical protein